VPVHHIAKYFTDARIVIETQHGRLGQRRGKLLAVTLCHATDSDDSSGASGSLENGVDGIFFSGLDESAGVDENDIRLSTFGDEGPTISGESRGEFLGIDLVPCASARVSAGAKGPINAE